MLIGMPALVETADFVVERDDTRRIVFVRRVFVRRTDSRFAQHEIAAVFAPVEAACAAFDGTWALLLDVRRAPARLEEGFDRALSVHFEPLMARFRRRAVVVRSAAGLLQVHRVSTHVVSQDRDTAVFKDDVAAEAFLVG